MVETEYKLTKSFFMEFELELSRALGLERPAYIGTAMSGFMALDLAMEHPDQFGQSLPLIQLYAVDRVNLDTAYHPISVTITKG